MARSQCAQIMRFVAFQNIGFQQRIGHDAAQRDAMIGKHMTVELEVLANPSAPTPATAAGVPGFPPLAAVQAPPGVVEASGR